jgi:hypothetical protein
MDLNYSKLIDFLFIFIPILILLSPPNPQNIFKDKRNYQCIVQNSKEEIISFNFILREGKVNFNEVKLSVNDTVYNNGYYILPKRIGKTKLLVNLKFLGFLKNEMSNVLTPNFEIVDWKTENYVPYLFVTDYNKIFCLMCCIIIGTKGFITTKFKFKNQL